MITALIPAHQEERGITAAIESLRAQTVPPERIVVSVDNCTDRTDQFAQEAGALVYVTQGNTHRKAGALNQALAWLSAESDLSSDLVLVVDADTVLSPTFIETAMGRLAHGADLAAVGGVFRATPPTSWLERAQENEWLRYARQLRRSGKVQVLSGTAALIRMGALQRVMDERGRTLPGHHGDAYHRDAATEDFCLTVALKSLGYRLASPSACQTTTEVMPTWSMLWAQRTRWYGGALQVLGFFGMNRTTVSYFGQQAMLALGVIGMSLYIWLTIALGIEGNLHPTVWIGLTVIFWTERVVTVWRGGWRSRFFAAAFVPELAYEMFLQGAFVISLIRRLRRTSIEWRHVED